MQIIYSAIFHAQMRETVEQLFFSEYLALNFQIILRSILIKTLENRQVASTLDAVYGGLRFVIIFRKFFFPWFPWQFQNMHNFLALSLILTYLVIATPTSTAISVHFNQFIPIPNGSVSVSADGLTATLTEASQSIAISLSNDPGLGDPVIIDPGVDTILSFDYDFTEGIEENDLFEAFILDADGNLIDANRAISKTDSGQGSIIFDLSDLINEATLGIQFQLSSVFGDSGSTSIVTISNLQVGQYTLSVLTTPFNNVNITGFPSGTTNYVRLVSDNASIDLTAPEILTSGNREYFFYQWSRNNISQQLGEKNLAFSINSNTELIAHYVLKQVQTLNPGWNLVSTPLDIRPNSQVDTFFAIMNSSTSVQTKTVWTWDKNQFLVAETLDPGKGYWIFNADSTLIDIEYSGDLPLLKRKVGNKGWNLAGIIDTSPIEEPENPEICGLIFGWDTVRGQLVSIDNAALLMEKTNTLQPGAGYWLYLKDAADLVLANP